MAFEWCLMIYLSQKDSIGFYRYLCRIVVVSASELSWDQPKKQERNCSTPVPQAWRRAKRSSIYTMKYGEWKCKIEWTSPSSCTNHHSWPTRVEHQRALYLATPAWLAAPESRRQLPALPSMVDKAVVVVQCFPLGNIQFYMSTYAEIQKTSLAIHSQYSNVWASGACQNSINNTKSHHWCSFA